MPCPLPYNQYVLDTKVGDVNGDGIPDIVYLVGEKPFGLESPFSDSIFLMIEDGRTCMCYKIPLKENAGYNPTLFLGDFDKNGVNDIFISIDSGGSGGYAFYYVYSFLYNQPKLLFDFEQFNQQYQYSVDYLDDYKVKVISHTLRKEFIIDISYKGDDYLSKIYDKDGNLINPISGQVLPLGGLFPVDYNRDGTYELLAIQRIIGQYNADTLGYVQTVLKWNGTGFKPINQNVAVLGKDY